MSRNRTTRFVGAVLVAGLAAAGLAVASSQSAGAAVQPNAQSVGRFLDGAVGAQTLESLVDVKDARATNPGSVSDQNPLDVNVLQTLDLPLTGALQFPQLLGITLGAVNQVAVAKSDGYSYGASGAVANSGGVSVGGNNAAFPADATIDLSATGIAGNALPGPDVFGGIKVKIGAVSALAQTPAGVAKPGSTNYNIAGLSIQAGSPLLASLITPVTKTVATLITTLAATGKTLGLSLPASCPLNTGSLPNLSLEGGAITINSTTGALTIDLAKLLDQLNLNLNALPANTDLIDLLLDYLTSPGGLADGVSKAVNGLVNDLENGFGCTPSALQAILTPLVKAGTTVQTKLTSLLSTLAAGAGPSPLGPLGDVLKKIIDIGVNVQPNGPAGSFASQLKATPNQDTPVVPGQTIVRAIEIKPGG
jgi:hypothetical protein